MEELEALKKKQSEEAEASRSFKGKGLADPPPSPPPSPRSQPPPHSPPPVSPPRHFMPPRETTPPAWQTMESTTIVPPTTVATTFGTSTMEDVLARSHRQISDLLERNTKYIDEIAQLKKEAEAKDNLIAELTMAGLESSTHKGVEVLKKGMQQVRNQKKTMQDHWYANQWCIHKAGPQWQGKSLRQGEWKTTSPTQHLTRKEQEDWRSL